MSLKFVLLASLLVLQMTSVFSLRLGGRKNGGLLGLGALGSRRNTLVNPDKQIEELQKQLSVLQKQQKLSEQKKEKTKKAKKEDDDILADSEEDEDLVLENPFYTVADTTRDFTEGLHEANQNILRPRLKKLARTSTGLFAQPAVAIARPLGLERLVTGSRKLLLKAADNGYDLASNNGRLAGHVAADFMENAGNYGDGVFQGLQGLVGTGQDLINEGLGAGLDLVGGLTGADEEEEEKAEPKKTDKNKGKKGDK